MNENYARKTVRDWRCHCCWGELEKFQLETAGKWDVRCQRLAVGLCSGGGFVSAHYVEKRRQQDASDFINARYNLAWIFPKSKPASEAELLQALGF